MIRFYFWDIKYQTYAIYKALGKIELSRMSYSIVIEKLIKLNRTKNIVTLTSCLKK